MRRNTAFEGSIFAEIDAGDAAAAVEAAEEPGDAATIQDAKARRAVGLASDRHLEPAHVQTRKDRLELYDGSGGETPGRERRRERLIAGDV